MNGADSVMQAAAAAGVRLCFANPGTTEMELVAALDAVDIDAVLGLHENVCTGAADGFARMSGGPAMVLLHLGPGLANGVANLHNARRAGSPVVVVVGDHATWHRSADAPLTTDIAALAATVSVQVTTATSARSLASATAATVAAARAGAGPATLIVPQDLAWTELDVDAVLPADPPPAPPGGPDEVTVDETARRLIDAAGDGLLILGGDALRAPGLAAAAMVADQAGARTRRVTFPARLERGADIEPIDAIPYFPEQAAADLAATRLAVLIGAPAPVAFFGGRDGLSRLLPDACEVIDLGGSTGGGRDIVARLAERVAALRGATSEHVEADRGPWPPTVPHGPFDHRAVAALVAAHQPTDAIVVHEAATSGAAWEHASAGAPPHTVLHLTGGAIGQGLPVAVGAALAGRDRKVLALQADGSGLYSAQALWTMAHHALDVCVVVMANQRYRILQIEARRAGLPEDSSAVEALTRLSEPTIDWVQLAGGFGVAAHRAESAPELDELLARAMSTRGPRLIEARW